MYRLAVSFLTLCAIVSGTYAEDVRNRSLEQAADALAKDIFKAMGDKEKKLTFGTFGPHSKAKAALFASMNGELERVLIEAMKANNIAVGRVSNFVLECKYYEVEDTSTLLQLLKLEVTLVDRTTEKRDEFSNVVSNQTHVHRLLGIPYEAPPEAKPKEFNEAYKKEIDKYGPPMKGKEPPKPALKGNTIFAKENSAFGIEILTKNAGAGDYATCTPKDDDGLAFVPINKGDVYAVKLINNADFDVAIALSIDGLSMFVASDAKFRDAKTNEPVHHFVIVPKKSSAVIRGWFVTLAKSDEFKVTSYAESLVGQLRASQANLGVITACFHAAVPKGQPFPAGEPKDPNAYSQSPNATGRGASVDQKYEIIERQIGQLRATAAVRYSR